MVRIDLSFGINWEQLSYTKVYEKKPFSKVIPRLESRPCGAAPQDRRVWVRARPPGAANRWPPEVPDTELDLSLFPQDLRRVSSWQADARRLLKPVHVILVLERALQLEQHEAPEAQDHNLEKVAEPGLLEFHGDESLVDRIRLEPALSLLVFLGDEEFGVHRLAPLHVAFEPEVGERLAALVDLESLILEAVEEVVDYELGLALGVVGPRLEKAAVIEAALFGSLLAKAPVVDSALLGIRKHAIRLKEHAHRGIGESGGARISDPDGVFSLGVGRRF